MIYPSGHTEYKSRKRCAIYFAFQVSHISPVQCSKSLLRRQHGTQKFRFRKLVQDEHRDSNAQLPSFETIRSFGRSMGAKAAPGSSEQDRKSRAEDRLHNPGQRHLPTHQGNWIFKNGPSRPLFRLFSSFQTNITIFTANKCEKCPSCKWRWDSNPQPSEHESPPITTRPGIPRNSY